MSKHRAGIDNFKNALATSMGNARRLHTTVYLVELKDHWTQANDNPLSNEPAFEFTMAKADWDNSEKTFALSSVRFQPKVAYIHPSDVVMPTLLRNKHLFSTIEEPLECLQPARIGFVANRMRHWSRDAAKKSFTTACEGEGRAHSINVDSFQDAQSNGPGSGGVNEIIEGFGKWIGGGKTADAFNFTPLDHD